MAETERDEAADLRARLEQSEVNFARLVIASRKAIKAWVLSVGDVPDNLRPSFDEWNAALDEFEQVILLGKNKET